MSDRLRGRVKWYDHQKGFGFITQADGGDFFFHYSGVRKDVDRRDLGEGDAVEFSTEDAPKGPRAVDIAKI